MFEMIIAFAVGIIILCLIAKIISLPVKLLWKFITNSLIGAVMLWVVNLFGAGIPIDIVRALIAGIFGIPCAPSSPASSASQACSSSSSTSISDARSRTQRHGKAPPTEEGLSF